MRIKKLIFTAGPLLLILVIFIIIFSSRHGISKQSNPDLLDLENAIIIEGLEMTSDRPLSDNIDNSDSGEIIRDDTFYIGKEHIIEPDSSKSPGSNIQGKDDTHKSAINTGPKELMQRLKHKDNRWHGTSYRIRKGDNLWDIANSFDIDYKLIIRYNTITKPDHLRTGKIIIVPNRRGYYYTVRKGDTLSSISLTHKIPMERIISQNEIKGEKSIIHPGMKFFLPDARKSFVNKCNKNKSSESRICNNKKIKKIKKSSKRQYSFIWPLRGKITSGFGNRTDPFTKTRKFHCGIDISVNPGTPIHASSSGIVIFSGWKEGYGKVIVLKHSNGYITVYAHNKKHFVKKGQKVKNNQVIAHSGMTGAVTGAHLHFEIRKYLTPLNPIRFLR